MPLPHGAMGLSVVVAFPSHTPTLVFVKNLPHIGAVGSGSIVSV